MSFGGSSVEASPGSSSAVVAATIIVDETQQPLSSLPCVDVTVVHEFAQFGPIGGNFRPALFDRMSKRLAADALAFTPLNHVQRHPQREERHLLDARTETTNEVLDVRPVEEAVVENNARRPQGQILQRQSSCCAVGRASSKMNPGILRRKRPQIVAMDANRTRHRQSQELRGARLAYTGRSVKDDDVTPALNAPRYLLRFSE